VKDLRHDRDAERERRTQQQRTRQGAVGGIAIVAVAAVVLIAPTFISTSPTTNDATDTGDRTETTSDRTPADPFATTPCPPGPDELGARRKVGPTIGRDAVSVRLCLGRELDMDEVAWRAPVDALVQTDAFLDAVAALDPPDESRCRAVRLVPDPVLLVVGYPDGRTEYASTSADTCSTVQVGGPRSSRAVVAAWLDALEAQRAELATTTAPDVDVQCPRADGDRVDPDLPLVPLTRGPSPAETTSFVRLVRCGSDGATESDAGAVVAINAAWPESIRDLSQQDPLAVNRCPHADANVPSAFLVTAAGDVLELEFVACGNYRVHGYGRSEIQFLPDESVGLL